MPNDDIKSMNHLNDPSYHTNTAKNHKEDMKNDLSCACPELPSQNWLSETMKDWIIPTFGIPDQPLPKLRNIFNTRSQLADLGSGHNDTALANLIQDLFFVKQIDCKYLACTAKTTQGNLLVLLDQHAVHERIRVNALLESTCQDFLNDALTQMDSPAVQMLPRALYIAHDIPSHVLECARAWGFHFKHIEDVLLVAVPILLEKTVPTVDQIQEMLLNFTQDTLGQYAHMKRQNGLHWSHALALIPRQIRDTLNRKACRGAIMFNDELDTQTCVELIQDLLKVDLFRFQCAHGRPSIVPIALLDPDSLRAQTDHIRPEKSNRDILWQEFM